MSHAVVVVAVDGKWKRHGSNAENDIEAAIAHEMAPFAEEGEFFGDGSRWDWYAVGGRWPDFFGNWGAMVRKGKFDSAQFQLTETAALKKSYHEAFHSEQAKSMNEGMRAMVYGIKPGESEEDFVKRLLAPFPVGHAFLKDQRWHEGSRMGWFGGETKTECERKAPTETLRRCKAKARKQHGNSEAAVVTWNETSEQWGDRFFERFVKPLDDNDWLVAVDYHV